MITWTKATDEAKENYRNVLENSLKEMELPGCVMCTNLHCSEHTDQIEEYTLNVLKAVESSSLLCLPSSISTSDGKPKKRVLPGWNEYVKPYAEENIFWNSVWKSQGSPKCGEVYERMKYCKNQYSYAVRRLKRCNDSIQNSKFLDGLLNSNSGRSIFEEIRQFRGKQILCSNRVDDHVGSSDIAQHFANTYSKLYNNVKNGDILDQLSERISNNITDQSMKQIDRINEALIVSALQKLKRNKRDALMDIISDCYIDGPAELVKHLTTLIKLFLVHGSVPEFVLQCTLLPLVKDKFGDITSSNNYRAIASGCLLLKLLDIVILQLEGNKLSFSELQFAYQANVSTTVCSWAVTSVVEYFNTRGTTVYGAAMDMSKAFDMVEWSELFLTLLDKNVECIFLRLILFIYTHQKCNVKWCGECSGNFSVSNGVRQGAVSSAVLFAVYIDNLLKLLEMSKFGCYIQGVFYGAFIFADDIFLLSASRTGLQALVDICHDFATVKNLTFGTNTIPSKSKTKCIIFSRKAKDHIGVVNITLNGALLPWVKTVLHLGCTLDSNNSMKNDISIKRGRFIGKVNSLLQELHFASEEVLLNVINTHTTSFYGSPLWDLYSPDCEKLYKSWNVAMRNVLRVDRRTHRYLLEPLTGNLLHPKAMLASRLVGFYRSQLNSPKFCVRFLMQVASNDKRTVIGKVLDMISKECNSKIEELSPGFVKKTVKYAVPSDDEQWRIPLATNLHSIRSGREYVPGFSKDEIELMLQTICVS